MTAEIALPSGHALLEYRIEATLGVGGFGLTYLATDTNLNMRVAIKEYLPSDLALRSADQSVRSRSDASLSRFTWGRARFLDESRTLASFRHPNIVRVLRFFEANETAYMVMEFVAGQALNQWIRPRRPLTDEALRALALALLDGIDVVHRAGYLHRDVKPNNIFMRDDGTPVLLDFGSARAASVDAERTAVVSPGYAPLEQYHAHGNQGPWTDLYAVGGVLYWAVTGQRPVEATARVPDDTMPSVTQAPLSAEYSPQLLRLIDWALSPSEKRRPQSVAELRQLLASRGGAQSADASTGFATTAVVPRSESSAATGPVTGTSFAAATLKALATDLAGYLGPVASVVVKRAAKVAPTMADLIAALAAEIDDETERAGFRRRHAVPGSGDLRRTTAPAVGQHPTTAASAPAILHLDRALLGRIEADLAQYLGAVAGTIVRRTASRAHSESEFYSLLAQQIDDPVERRAFLRRATSVSGRL